MSPSLSGVTAGVRTLQWPIVGFAAMVGWSFTQTPLERLRATPTLRYADHIIPLDLWGWVFIAVAIVLALAIALDSRHLFKAGLTLLIVWLGAFAAAAAVAASEGLGTWSAWAWPAFACASCFAVLRSIESREV